MFSFFRVSSSFTSPVPSSFPSHYLSPTPSYVFYAFFLLYFFPCSSHTSFSITFSICILLHSSFPYPSSCSSTPAFPSSCHASFFLSFPSTSSQSFSCSCSLSTFLSYIHFRLTFPLHLPLFLSYCRLFSGSCSYYSLSFILSFFHMFSQFGLTTSVPSHSSVVVSFSLNVCFADVMS